MRDEEVKAMFVALDAEPRPTFITTLRERLEREWLDEEAVRRSAGERHVPPADLDVGDMIQVREAVTEGEPGRESGRRWTHAYRHRGRRVARRHVDGRGAQSGCAVTGGRAGDVGSTATDHVAGGGGCG